MKQRWVQVFAWARGDSSALTASQTPTTILPTDCVATLSQGFLDAVGDSIRITLYGRISNITTTPGTLTLDVRFGAVVVFNGGAMQLNAVAKTNVPFKFTAILTARSLGGATAATMFGIGEFLSESVVGSPVPSVGGSGILMLPAVTPAVGAGFDSTAAQAVNVFGTWSLNNANSIQTHLAVFESLN